MTKEAKELLSELLLYAFSGEEPPKSAYDLSHEEYVTRAKLLDEIAEANKISTAPLFPSFSQAAEEEP